MNLMQLTEKHAERIQSFNKVELLTESANQGADLSQWCGPIFDQQMEGSCTACTTRDILWWLQNKYGYTPVVDPDVQALYYFGRLLYGDVVVDNGSTVHDAFQGAITYGVIPSSAEPYNPSTIFDVPPLNQIQFQANGVTDLTVTTASIRASLDAGVPIGIGVSVMDSLFNPTLYNGMHIVDAVGTFHPDEGHAVFVPTYKPDPVHGFLYKFQNSWGLSYGDGGFAWFTEAYLQKCLGEVCTLDIPKVRTAPTPPPPIQPVTVVLKVGTNHSQCVVGNMDYIWVELTGNGSDMVGQTVEVSIDSGSPGGVPIMAPGKNGFPWGSDQAGVHTIVASWNGYNAYVTIEFVNAPPTPTPTPPTPPTPEKLYHVQVGAFRVKSNADAMAAKLKAAGFTNTFIKFE